MAQILITQSSAMDSQFFLEWRSAKGWLSLSFLESVLCAKGAGGFGSQESPSSQPLLLKRCWEVASNATISASFLHKRFLVEGLQPTSYYKKSSIWLGIKSLWPTLLSNLHWLVGNGHTISFWKDNWLGEVIARTCNIDHDFLGLLDDKVRSFIAKW